MNFGTSFLPASGWTLVDATMTEGSLEIEAGGSASVTITEIDNTNILPEALLVLLTAESYPDKYNPTSFARLYILYEDDNTYDAIIPIVNIADGFSAILWPSISNYDIDLSAFTSLTFSIFSSVGITLTAWSLAKSLNDKLLTDKFYYGIKISTETGFEAIASDNRSRAFFNADTMKFQAGDGTGFNWEDKLYYEYDSETGETNLVFDGALSATIINALSVLITPNFYAGKATIAELTVDELDTSNKIKNFLANDTSDVLYQRIYDQYHKFITAQTDGSSYSQATNRRGEPLYWVDDSFETASVEESEWPVYVYDYEEVTQLELAFEFDGESHVPKLVLGAGTGSGDNGKAKIYKRADGFYIDYYKSTDGTLLRFEMTDDGIDFSNWSNILFGEGTQLLGMLQLFIKGKNNHRIIDYYGINPDFIKRANNVVPNSGFEVYDSDTMAPNDWVGDGVVSMGDAWEGSASLKLEPGQKTQSQNGITVGNRSRVSFRHKGGAVKVRVTNGEGQETYDWTTATTAHFPSGTSQFSRSPTAVQIPDGRVLYMYSTNTGIYQAYIESVEKFVSQDNVVIDPVIVEEELRTPRVLVFQSPNGNLFHVRCFCNSSDSKASVRIYKCSVGDGSSWQLYSNVVEVAGSTGSDAYFGQHPLGIYFHNSRWILISPRPYYNSGWLMESIGIYTSDDNGLTWARKYSMDGLTDMAYLDSTSRNIALNENGDLCWSISISYATGRNLYFRSTDGGDNWGSYVVTTGFPYGVYQAFSLINDSNKQYILRSNDSHLFSATQIPTALPAIGDVFDDWEYVSSLAPMGFSAGVNVIYQKLGDTLVAMKGGWAGVATVLGIEIKTNKLTLYDNSTDDGRGDPVIWQEGEELTYEAQDDWIYPTPPALEGINDPEPYISQGFHTFYFEPTEVPVFIEFECADENDPCYIDAVQLEPDFNGKWPSVYMPGVASMPTGKHADTHKTGGSDSLTASDIGAETPTGAQAKADAAQEAAEEYADELPKSFVELTDAPNSYENQAGKVVKVNNAENGLIFGAGGGGSTEGIVLGNIDGGDSESEYPTEDVTAVNSINGLDGDVIISPGDNIDISVEDNTITISSTGGGSVDWMTVDANLLRIVFPVWTPEIPPLLTNGDITSSGYWNAGFGTTNLVCDFGKSIPLQKAQWWMYYSDGRSYRGVGLYASNDNVAWTTLRAPETYAFTSAGLTVNIGTSYRYLKFYCEGNATYNSSDYVEIIVTGKIAIGNS